MHNLRDDTSIIIKGADKESAVIVWDRDDYLKEAELSLDGIFLVKRLIILLILVLELVDFICYRKFTNVFIRYQEDQLFLIVGISLRISLNLLITIYNLW